MNKARREAIQRTKEEAFICEQIGFHKARSRLLPHIFVEVPSPDGGIADELRYPRYLLESELSDEALQMHANTIAGREEIFGRSEPGALRFPQRHQGLPPKPFTARGQVAFRNPFAGSFQLFYGSYQDGDGILTCENVGLFLVWNAMTLGYDLPPEYYFDAYYAIIIGNAATIRVGATQLPQAPGYHIWIKEGESKVSRINRPLDSSVLSIETDRWKKFQDISEF